jgi:23S rRNA pseudouridine1911/1915/1917 synthase
MGFRHVHRWASTRPGAAGGSEISAEPRQIALEPSALGIRLDRFLASELQLSRAQVRRLLERGAITLDGRVLALTAKGLSLPGEGVLAVAPFRSPDAQRAIAEPELVLPELASGAEWLAVDKPAGMPVHPLREEETGTALNALIARHPEIHGVGEAGLRSGVVHRLDVDTSGVMLFATGDTGFARLRGAFAAHHVEKRYRAILLGNFDPPGGVREISMPLMIAQHRPARVRIATAGEQARGLARTIRQRVIRVTALADATLVEVEPATGFLHQIRASLAQLGHPVVGDTRYGGRGAVSEACGAKRHLLHACSVRFEDVAASSPDAPDFAQALVALGG